MKKVLLLGALLSTMAFGAGAASKGMVSGTDGTSAKTSEINFSGTAYKPVTITAANDSVEFGTLVVGQISTATVGLNLTGDNAKTATLSAEVKGLDSSDPGSVVASFTGTGQGRVEFSGEAGTDELTLVYTPTKAGSISGSVVVTATYNE